MRKFQRPGHAVVVAYLALFVALGGTGYAAITLPRDSVGATQIKPGAVHASDLAPDSVDSSKVADGALKQSDFNRQQNEVKAFVARGDIFQREPLKLSVPAGRYAVTAKGRVFNGGARQDNGCQLSPGERQPFVIEADDSMDVTLLDVASFKAAGAITFTCVGPDIQFYNPQISAIRLGPVNP